MICSVELLRLREIRANPGRLERGIAFATPPLGGRVAAAGLPRLAAGSGKSITGATPVGGRAMPTARAMHHGFLKRRSQVRVLSGPPANKINNLDGLLATVATVIGDSPPQAPAAQPTAARGRGHRSVRTDRLNSPAGSDSQSGAQKVEFPMVTDGNLICALLRKLEPLEKSIDGDLLVHAPYEGTPAPIAVSGYNDPEQIYEHLKILLDHGLVQTNVTSRFTQTGIWFRRLTDAGHRALAQYDAKPPPPIGFVHHR
jgi:hypothetical protein